MTQIPWFDKFWHKNRFMAKLRSSSGNSIVKIAADNTNERLQRKREKLISDDEKDVNERDFLSRFIEIQERTENIPPW